MKAADLLLLAFRRSFFRASAFFRQIENYYFLLEPLETVSVGNRHLQTPDKMSNGANGVNGYHNGYTNGYTNGYHHDEEEDEPYVNGMLITVW